MATHRKTGVEVTPELRDILLQYVNRYCKGNKSEAARRWNVPNPRVCRWLASPEDRSYDGKGIGLESWLGVLQELQRKQLVSKEYNGMTCKEFWPSGKPASPPPAASNGVLVQAAAPEGISPRAVKHARTFDLLGEDAQAKLESLAYDLMQQELAAHVRRSGAA